MTVYVRLAAGGEDSFPPHNGCPKCASPNLVHHADIGYKENRSNPTWACRDCDAMYIKKPPLFNPRIRTDTANNLSLFRAKTQIAYYPSGTWTTWRQD